MHHVLMATLTRRAAAIAVSPISSLDARTVRISIIFWNIARTNRRSDTLIEVNRNFCPGMGYSSVEDDSNDALKTKLHTLIADGAAVLPDICPTGE